MLVEQMTWQEYRDHVGKSVIILPVGALEQHGPHLPLNVDIVVPSRLSAMAAEELDAMVLPILTYGYKSQPSSGGGPLFPGTTSLNGDTLVHLVLDILRETYRHGGRRIVVFNGHFENSMFLTEAIDLFTHDAPGARVMLLDWWAVIGQEMVDVLFADCEFPGWDLEHASVVETSLIQYLAPELVRKDRIVDDPLKEKPLFAMFPPPPDIIPLSGILYRATPASREKGEKLVKYVLPRIVDVIRKGFA